MSGVTILFAQRRVVRFLAFQRVSLPIWGIGLILYAVTLVFNAHRPQVKITDVWIAVRMDVTWVVGSYVLIFVVPFSAGGKWVVGVVAELVLVFAVLQFVGIRRIRRQSEQFS